jgi:hypothetical protein
VFLQIVVGDCDGVGVDDRVGVGDRDGVLEGVDVHEGDEDGVGVEDGVVEGESERDGVGEVVGEGDGEGDVEGVGEGDGEDDGDDEAEDVDVGVGEEETEGDREGDEESDVDGLDDTEGVVEDVGDTEGVVEAVGDREGGGVGVGEGDGEDEGVGLAEGGRGTRRPQSVQSEPYEQSLVAAPGPPSSHSSSPSHWHVRLQTIASFGYDLRPPQSAQSVPYSHTANTAPGPPSSHSLSRAVSQVFKHSGPSSVTEGSSSSPCSSSPLVGTVTVPTASTAPLTGSKAKTPSAMSSPLGGVAKKMRLPSTASGPKSYPASSASTSSDTFARAVSADVEGEYWYIYTPAAVACRATKYTSSPHTHAPAGLELLEPGTTSAASTHSMAHAEVGVGCAEGVVEGITVADAGFGTSLVALVPPSAARTDTDTVVVTSSIPLRVDVISALDIPVSDAADSARSGSSSSANFKPETTASANSASLDAM